MTIYVNLTCINFGATLGVWHFGRMLLNELAKDQSIRLIGLLPELASWSAAADVSLAEVRDLSSCRNMSDGVELLLHHFQSPQTACRYVCIIHDLHLYDVPWKYAEPTKQKTQLEELIAGASAVVTEFPRTYYDLPKVMSHVPNSLFLSLTPDMISRKEAHKAYIADNFPVKYLLSNDDVVILYPAQLQQHKNHLSLFKAMKILVKSFPKLKLICCGSDASHAITARLREAIRELALDSSVIIPGRVDDEELVQLYSRANLIVSPSVAEGGAYIAQEAILRGKSVAIAAIRPALLHLQLMKANIPTFDPLNIESIVVTITNALGNPRDSSASAEVIKGWTWNRVATQFCEILRWVNLGCQPGKSPSSASAELGIAMGDMQKVS